MSSVKGQKRNKEDWAHMKVTRKTTGNPNWKGDKVTYFGVHSWVQRNWQKPTHCEICGIEKRLEWSNKDHKYTRIRIDWQAVCRRCHIIFDRDNNGLQMNKMPLVGWSRKYDRCVTCGKNNIKYKANGKCSRCYYQIHTRTTKRSGRPGESICEKESG